MKIALLGGAGTRVPLVVSGLIRSHRQLPCDELALYDTNSEREAAIAAVCDAMVRRASSKLKITVAENPESALDGADFILCSVRVGGAQGRIWDERIALAHDLLGQETVGAGGWAMALRSIPVVVEYARLAQRISPRAWLLNFTNPVGIVLQALVSEGIDQTIGICDTPREMFENAAGQLGIDASSAFFDYFGLNHLGWVRRIVADGKDLLPHLLAQPQNVEKIYHVPLFEQQYLDRTRLLPTEYVYFYLHGDEAAAKLKRANRTRGEAVADQEQRFFASLTTANGNADRMLDAYDSYLAERHATYFRLETANTPTDHDVARARAELYEKAAGYDRIAVDVMRAIASDQRVVFPVDVANGGAISDFAADDAVELPCEIDARGARPLPFGAIPEPARELLLQVKQYERLTAKAALTGSLKVAADALRTNPLVGDRVDCDRLAKEYRDAHAALGYLR